MPRHLVDTGDATGSESGVGTALVEPSPVANLRHVLGVIVDLEDDIGPTLAAAVRLADNDRARLSLVKTCDIGPVVACFGPLGVCATVAAPDDTARQMACRVLARVADSVPAHIPLTTVVLGPHTQRNLCELVRIGDYDAVVVPEVLRAMCLKIAGRVNGDLQVFSSPVGDLAQNSGR